MDCGGVEGGGGIGPNDSTAEALMNGWPGPSFVSTSGVGAIMACLCCLLSKEQLLQRCVVCGPRALVQGLCPQSMQ